jgi:hypothetical protein
MNLLSAMDGEPGSITVCHVKLREDPAHILRDAADWLDIEQVNVKHISVYQDDMWNVYIFFLDVT